MIDYFLNLPNANLWINNGVSQGKTPLFIAAEENNLPYVKAFLAKGADVNIGSNANETVLHKAVDNRNFEMLKLFLVSGATYKTVNQEGVESTPLLEAIDIQNFEMVVALIQAGADTNLRDSSGYSPLSAAESNHKSAMKENASIENAAQILEFLKAHGATAKKIKK